MKFFNFEVPKNANVDIILRGMVVAENTKEAKQLIYGQIDHNSRAYLKIKEVKVNKSAIIFLNVSTLKFGV